MRPRPFPPRAITFYSPSRMLPCIRNRAGGAIFTLQSSWTTVCTCVVMCRKSWELLRCVHCCVWGSGRGLIITRVLFVIWYGLLPMYSHIIWNYQDYDVQDLCVHWRMIYIFGGPLDPRVNQTFSLSSSSTWSSLHKVWKTEAAVPLGYYRGFGIVAR